MARAQIADPDLAAKLAAGRPEQIRPCIRCNQTCQVRDVRNPIVTCVGEPSSGHETDDPACYEPARRTRDVIVVGAGPAGLETARVAALRGHRVRVIERSDHIGGVAAVAGPGAPLVAWWRSELERLGVTIELGAAVELGVDVRELAPASGAVIVQCTGSRPGDPNYQIVDGATVFDVAVVRLDPSMLPAEGAVVLIDPIGGPIAVALAEDLGERAVLVTPDNVVGNELSRTGDLAPANVRLQQRSVRIERRTIVREVRLDPAPEGQLLVEVEDRFSGVRRLIPCSAVVDCGFRLPDPPLAGAHLRAGDCVAPRTIHEAVLESRRAALAVDQV